MNRSTRTFYLSVNPWITPITRQKIKGYNGLQLNDGSWFNISARIPGSQIVQIEYLRNYEKFVNDLLIGEARRLQQFWYQNVNKYFNRRAFGMYYYRGGRGGFLGASRRFRKKYTNRSQYRKREHTGQLKRALIVKSKSNSMVELYVRPCYAKTGRPVDYVNILIRGATPKTNPYIPVLDKRVNKPGSYWHGISPAYWAMWQAVFEKQITNANNRINNRIREYIISKKIMEARDMGRAARVSKVKKDITTLSEEVRSRPQTKPIVKSSGFLNDKFMNNKFKNTFGKFSR